MCGRAARQVDETLSVPRMTFSDVLIVAGQAGGRSVSSVPSPQGEAPSRIRQAGLWPSQEGVGSSFTMASGLSQSRHRGAPSQCPPDRRAVGRNRGPCSLLGQPGLGSGALQGRGAALAGVKSDREACVCTPSPHSTRGCRAGVVACPWLCPQKHPDGRGRMGSRHSHCAGATRKPSSLAPPGASRRALQRPRRRLGLLRPGAGWA